MQRRTFLKGLGGAGGLLLGGVIWRVGGFWWDQSATTGMKVLSQHEVVIVQTIAEAMFPGDLGMPAGNRVGMPEFFDTYLAGIAPGTANLLRVLLHSIDDMALFADFGSTRFHLRPLEERIAILQAWHDSWLTPRRGAFASIKMIMGMGYCESALVIQTAGIDYSCGETA